MKKINFKFSKLTIIILIIVVSLIGVTIVMVKEQIKKPKVSNVGVNSSLPVNKKADNNVDITLTPDEEVPKDASTRTDKSVATTPQTEEVAQEEDTTPAVAPVRTFEQIVLSYPNMSSTDREVQCSMLILGLYPEKFTDDVREKNVKMIADAFSSSCSPFMGIQGDLSTPTSAIKSRDLLHDRGSGDFWQLRG